MLMLKPRSLFLNFYGLIFRQAITRSFTSPVNFPSRHDDDRDNAVFYAYVYLLPGSFRAGHF
jgi:hypothetical protein